METDKLLNALALGIFSLLFGVLLTALDFISFRLRNTSFLRIGYKSALKENLGLIALWSLGSGIVGVIGGLADIFNSKGMLQSSLLIAATWPILVSNFIENLGGTPGIQGPQGGAH